MSVESIQSRITDIQAKISSVTNKPQEKFQSVLQEKLGDVISSTSVGSELTVDNTTSGDLLTNQANLLMSNYGTNGLYSSNAASCPLCAAEATQNNQYATASISGNWDASMLPEGFEKAAPYMEYINEATQRYGMPQNLILGIMRAESDFDNNCVSSAGAKGLMQLMPETAEEVGVTDEFDPRQNILGSVEYVTKLINRYDGDVKLALAAYNTGPGKIARRGVTSSTSAEYQTVPQSIRDYADRVLRYAGYQV